MNTLHIVCPHCSGVNRVPSKRLGDGAVCGKCKNKLFIGEPVSLTVQNLQKNLDRNDIVLVIDFWAPWCGPCKMMGPIYSQAAGQLEPHVRLAKVNTEQEQTLAARFNIHSIPTIVIFKQGREVARQPGAMDLSKLLGWIRAHL